MPNPEAYGFSGWPYDQIIVFNDEEYFKQIVAANPHMVALMGADDYTKENFPGVFIAGLKSSAQPDNGET
ncbi:MAG: hypothetical protein ACI4L5_02555 [Negativibacillus sp.]